VLSINLWGVIYMIHFFVPSMIKRQKGRILITSSGLGLFAFPGMTPYSTSKFAVVGLAESLRTELYPHNIHVNLLCPGIVNTNIVKAAKIDIRTKNKVSAKKYIEQFYQKVGSNPRTTARAGLKALERDIAVMPTPLYVWSPYLLHRLFPFLLERIIREVWKQIGIY